MSAARRQHAKQAIQIYDAQLEEIRCQIRDLDFMELAVGARPVVLEAERAKIKRLRYPHLAVLQPWRLLPFDVLEDILILVNEQDLTYTFPTTLSLVSSEWRGLANAAPRLWTRIKIADSIGLVTARKWIERSKAVSVAFSCFFGTPPPLSVGFVRDNLARTAELTIRVSDNWACHRVLSGLNKPAPILRSFRLRHQNRPRGTLSLPENASKHLFAGKFPLNLRSIEIISPLSKWPTGLMRHLSELVISTSQAETPLDILQMLELVPSIHRLEIWDCRPYFLVQTVEQPNGVVTMPALVQAHFGGVWIGTLLVVLAYLNLPVLQSLSIELETLTQLESLPIPTTFTPFPMLDVIHFSSTKDGVIRDTSMHSHLLWILGRCDNVRSLHLIGPVLSMECLNALVFEPSALLCRRLVRLHISRLKSRHITDLGRSIEVCLMSRRHKEDQVKAIDTLSFQKCRMWKDRATQYRPLVQTLKYDGKPIYRK